MREDVCEIRRIRERMRGKEGEWWSQEVRRVVERKNKRGRFGGI